MNKNLIRQIIHQRGPEYFINPLQPFSIPPEDIRKPQGFLMFSWGIKRQHRAVTG